MKRRKNLERAVILGLLLSTSVYGSAFAASVDVDDFVVGRCVAPLLDDARRVVLLGLYRGKAERQERCHATDE